MPRPRLDKPQASIHILLPPDDKEALMRWCSTNGMTISEFVRSEIQPKIDEGYSLKDF
jgi:hypothetical protein